MHDRRGHAALSRPSSGLLIWIVVFKVFKSTVLTVVGVLLLGYLHRDPVQMVVTAASVMNLSAGSAVFYKLLEFAMGLTTGKQVALAVTALGYAGLLGVEAVGLAKRCPWARWLTIGITASLLPFEIYEMAKHPGEPIRIVTFVANVAILIYLYKRKEVFER